MVAVQRQKLSLPHHGLQPVLHIGINDPHGIDLSGIEPFQQQLGDMPRPAQSGILRCILKASFNGNIPLREPAAAIFPHHIQCCILVVGQQLLSLPDGILVVGPGQPLVRRDQQAGRYAGQWSGITVHRQQITALNGAVRVEYACYFGLQCLEVGAGIGQLLLGLAQLGLRDQVHGVGDLLGLPDASDAPADLTGACHVLTARLCAGISPVRSSQIR